MLLYHREHVRLIMGKLGDSKLALGASYHLLCKTGGNIPRFNISINLWPSLFVAALSYHVAIIVEPPTVRVGGMVNFRVTATAYRLYEI